MPLLAFYRGGKKLGPTAATPCPRLHSCKLEDLGYKPTVVLLHNLPSKQLFSYCETSVHSSTVAHRDFQLDVLLKNVDKVPCGPLSLLSSSHYFNKYLLIISFIE